MHLPLGENLRRLRAEHSMTQEQLALSLGVTPQAVSRWESAAGYPDIELLPVIAAQFHTSVDILLGCRRTEEEQTMQDMKAALISAGEYGTDAEYLACARRAAARFPTEEFFRSELACALSRTIWEEHPDEDAMREAEGIWQALLSQTRDDRIRYDSIEGLVTLYARGCHDPDRARAMCERLPKMKYCREFLLSQGIGDGHTAEYIQDEIDRLTDCLGCAIHNLVLSEDLPNDPDTWERKIEMMRTSNKLYETIYGEDMMFYHNRLSFGHWIISTYEMSLGRAEDAMTSLERMADHAVAYDISYRDDHGKTYSSPYVNTVVYPIPGDPDFHELHEHSNSHFLLEKLQNHRYDPIRETERFQSVLARLREYDR